jgi:hypothetical protein
MNDFPKSENVGRWEAKDFWVTAGSWDTGYGPSYEIGIRRKSKFDSFILIQANWDKRTVNLAGEAIRMLLDAGLSPSEIKDLFS